MTIESLDTAAQLLGTSNDKAIDIAMAWIHRGEDVARAATIVAEGFDGKGMAADALTFFDLSLAASPTARAYAGRGMLRRARGDDAGAAEDFGHALALDPKSCLASLGQALILAANGDAAGALALLALLLEDEEYRTRALVERAKVFFATDRNEGAYRELLLAAELGHSGAAGRLANDGADTNGWSGKALIALASYYCNLDEPDLEAEASTLQLAIDKLEGKAKHDALVSLGLNQRSARAFDDAIATFQRAMALEPNGPAPAWLARTLFFANRNHEAETAALSVLTTNADKFEAHRTLGDLHAEEERFEEALAAFDQALPLAPSYAVASTHLGRARALFALDREPEARAAWIAAEDAGNARAREERREHFPAETGADFFDEGLEFLDEGDWESAREPFKQAAALFRAAMRSPGDFAARQLANVLTNLGNVFRQSGDIDAALLHLEEATRVRPAGYEALVMFGNVLRNAELSNDVVVRVEGEALHDARARLRKAIELHERSVNLAHGEPYAHYNLGLARQTAGLWRDAVKAFERALAYRDASKRQDAVFNIVKSIWKAGSFESARNRCDSLYTNDDLETTTRKNIEALIMRQPRYDGDFVVKRFAETLDTIIDLHTRKATAATKAFPFRFYGIRPADWAPGSNMGHEYRLRFREAPDAATRETIAKAVAQPWELIDDGYGCTWRWSGPFVQITLGERQVDEIDGFFIEVADMMKAIHAVAPLDEVVALNAQRLSSTTPEDEAWERWSLTVAPLPAPHPFSNDGQLFFSAYGEVGQWPAPQTDAAFDAARAAAMPERIDDDEDLDDDDDDLDEDLDGDD
ncbi:MAG: hypothetical protein J0I07_22940 [Myxococcales bacterium]|nr:hypothetical protein [Myxococcales bacterium]